MVNYNQPLLLNVLRKKTMKRTTNFLLILLTVMIVSCGARQERAQEKDQVDNNPLPKKEFYAEIIIDDTIKVGEPVELRFKVYNGTDTTATFLKWQTPFEPLLSKYLDIKDEQGNEVPYIGAMAKRMMPPPADAYLKVAPKDSLSTKVDILKGYALEKTGKYTITFLSSEMSGVKVSGPVTFNYIAR
jgi:hypothetical protein